MGDMEEFVTVVIFVAVVFPGTSGAKLSMSALSSVVLVEFGWMVQVAIIVEHGGEIEVWSRFHLEGGRHIEGRKGCKLGEAP